MPEYVKINEKERWKDLAKNKFYSSLNRNLFGDKDIIDVVAGKLKSSLKTQINGFKQGIEAAIFGLETYAGIPHLYL